VTKVYKGVSCVIYVYVDYLGVEGISGTKIKGKEKEKFRRILSSL